MVLCPNGHDNLGGLSRCRVCGLPLLDLCVEFASLIDSLAFRAEMGRRSPKVLLVGLGTVGANVIDISKATYTVHDLDYSYLAIDTDSVDSTNGSNSILRLRLGAMTPSAGTFCSIGEAVTRDDLHLVPFLRRAGLNHKDDNQAAFFVAAIGGGIGSAAWILMEKCRQLNQKCHTVALVIIPGKDESFHNHLNAYFGLSHLLENSDRQAADLVIAVRYDRMKTLRGVSTTGQELITDGLLAAFIDLLMKNLSSQYIAEVVRINQSLGVRLVIPCLALGLSIGIFGSVTNILESAIAYPAGQVSMQAVLACHLLLRVPDSQAVNCKKEAVNEQLWSLARRHLPSLKAVSSSITYSNEQHDRIEACILLGGDSAMSALFADDMSLTEFRAELDKDIWWQTYGLNEESMKLARDTITKYDSTLEKVRGERMEIAGKARDIITKSAPGVRRNSKARQDTHS